MSEKTKKAYMTIEAALVFPFVLGSIVFTVYLGFYLYNAALLKQTAVIAALRGSRITDATINESKEFVNKQLEQLSAEKLLLSKERNQSVTVSFNKVEAQINMEMEVPITEALPFFKEVWNLETKAEAIRINPVSIIRGVRKINEYTISE